MTPQFTTGDVITLKGRKQHEPCEIKTVSESGQCYWVLTKHAGIKVRRRIKFDRERYYVKVATQSD